MKRKKTNEYSWFSLGDKVKLLNDSKDKTYIIYSYTMYWDWRITYTLWEWEDYNVYEPWQVVEITPSTTMWFNT